MPSWLRQWSFKVSENLMLGSGGVDINDTTDHRVRNGRGSSEQSRQFLDDLREQLKGKRGYLRFKAKKDGSYELRRTTRPRFFKWFGSMRSAKQREVDSDTGRIRDNATNLIVDHIRNAYGPLRASDRASQAAYDKIINDLSDYLDTRSGNLGTKTFERYMDRLETFEKRCEAFKDVQEIDTSYKGMIFKDVTHDYARNTILVDLRDNKDFDDAILLGKGGEGEVVALGQNGFWSGYSLKTCAIGARQEIDKSSDINASFVPDDLLISKPAVYYIAAAEPEFDDDGQVMSLTHAGLYQVPGDQLDSFTQDERVYGQYLFVRGFVMPRMEGRDVFSVILEREDSESNGPYPFPANSPGMKTIAKDTINTLFGLHEAGLAHNDIKPENLMYKEAVNGRRARSTIIDVGLLTVGSTDRAGGTPGYAAPEMYAKKEHGGEVDYFSTAMTLLEMNQPGLRDTIAYALQGEGFESGSPESGSLEQQHVRLRSEFAELEKGKDKLRFVLETYRNHHPEGAARLDASFREHPAFRTLIVTLMEASDGGWRGEEARDDLRNHVLPNFLKS